MSTLPATAYQPPRVGRQNASNLIAKKRRAAPILVQLPQTSTEEVEDDQPTPKGAESRRDSVSSFNSLYDVSDDDSVMVPIRISNSIKKNLNVKPRSRAPRVPSLVIPTSPSGWPSIQKLRAAQAAQVAAGGKTTPLSPQALLQLATQTLQIPSKSATPSLAESLTSDELASMSPNTPASSRPDEEEQWDLPIQLHPQAMNTLQQISYDDAVSEDEHAIELTSQQMGEMQDRGLNINAVFESNNLVEEPCSAIEPISAISVPSPGGFFASLTSPVKQLWGSLQPDVPSTSMAEHFYNVPFDRAESRIVERVITLPAPTASGPPTARRDSHDVPHTPTVDELVIPADRVYEYDSNYEANLAQTASNNLSRTSLWLNAQSSYLAAFTNANPTTSSDDIKTQYATIKARNTPGPPPQRTPPTAKRLPPPPPPPKHVADPLFYHAFQHFLHNTPTATAFTQRHLRLDALTTQRRYLHAQHLRQLTSAFTVPPPPRSIPQSQGMPASLPANPADPILEAKRLACAVADRERAAQSQIQLNLWTLQASRFLAQGRLLPSVADKALSNCAAPKILDLAGQPTADWAWAVAWESRHITVTTAVIAGPSEAKPWENHRGPSNHRVVCASAPWSLPFADGEFDVVSARTLHSLLRVQGDGPFGHAEGEDEWALTFREIYRVLKPGGVFSYETLDASILPLPLPAQHAAAQQAEKEVPAPLAARASSFISLLTTLRYDPIPSVSNLSRLDGAGFKGAKEQVIVNMALCSKGDERQGVEALTGMVGSVMWERWMASTQTEAGVGKARVLDGVAGALENAGREGEGRWGWRVGRGWCRK